MDKKNIGTSLTLEQLREMDGKPVYCPDDGIWGIISVDSTGRWAGIPFFRGRTNVVNIEYDIESRGMSVYAYPPAHIDREAWEPCEVCKKQEDPCIKDGCFRRNRWKCGFGCDKYKEFQERTAVLRKSKFCPNCGRPLTEKAWDELEKRIGGAK